MIVPDECLAHAKLHRPQGDYSTELRNEWEILEPHLPPSVGSILDIGCGLAGIQVFLKRRYPNSTLTLLDSDGAKPQYGFRENCRPYGNKDLCETLLKSNNVTEFNWLPAGTNAPLAADLVISLLSWGFHYPLSTYNVSGLCIADLRKEKEPIRGRVIQDTPRYFRCKFFIFQSGS